MGGKGGGGSSSGKISYPAYMSDMHHQWLDNWNDDKPGQPGGVEGPLDLANFPDVAGDMLNATTAIGGNPYAGAVAYSPDVDLANAQDAIDDFNADLAAGWTSFLTSTIEGIDATIASPVEFKEMEDVVSDRIRRQQSKDIRRFNAKTVDIGAIQTNTYAIGLMYQEQLTQDHIHEFITGQENKLLATRLQLLGQFGPTRLDGFRAVVDQQGKLVQLGTTAKGDELQVNQQWEVAEATWDLDLFPFGANVLAGMAGATQTRGRPRRISSLSGIGGGKPVLGGGEARGGKPFGGGLSG